jgi:cyclopropane fatty-acyl-phospholipid synthase-like methyltransferase
MMDDQHLFLEGAKTLLDIGSGRGRLALQCFEQYGNLKRVIGVELSSENYGICEKALDNYVKFCQKKKKIILR